MKATMLLSAMVIAAMLTSNAHAQEQVDDVGLINADAANLGDNSKNISLIMKDGRIFKNTIQ